MQVDHSERAHSELGASSASRWLACPSSVNLSEGIEDTGSSEAALTGTCAHEVADMALTQGRPCVDFIGDVHDGIVVTQEMADYTQIYVDYVNKESEGKELSVEERIDLSFIDPRMFGSNDAIIYEEFGTLEVIDLKYGFTEVLPENNKQLMYYALGAAKGGNFYQVKMTIVQPRVNNPIKSWTVPIKVIEDYADELRQGVERVDSGIDCFEIGSHCHFCKAKPICPAKKKQAQEVARVDFADHMAVRETSLPDASTLSSLEIAKILEHGKSIKDWIDSVNKHAFSELEAGRKIDGYKLVAGKSNRVLMNPVEFENSFGAIFGEDLYVPKKLKGTGALEKLIGKNEVAPFFRKPPAKNTMAPESDKRPAVETAFSQDFGNYIETQPTQTVEDFSTMEF